MHKRRGEKWSLLFLFIMMMFSSFVFFEPSPYDFFMVLLIAFGFTFSLFIFHPSFGMPILLLLIFLISNIVSAVFSTNYFIAGFYFSITLYLSVSWFCLAGMACRYQQKFIQAVFNGYLVAACIAVLLGLLAYMDMLPFSEDLLSFGRVKSLFKDPNVYGPFVVIPALYSLYKAETSIGKKKLSFLGISIFLMTGVLMSFSRAAWGNMALTVIGYFFFVSTVPLKKRFITLLLFFAIAVPILIYIANTPLIESLFEQRLSMQNYDEDRFATQKAAFESGFSNLVGFGPGQSEENFDLSTHSLYARLFTENGLLGFISFITFVLLSLLQSLKNIFKADRNSKGLYVIIFSSLVGLIFNSIFIDTLHWRHFWLMLALAWCPIKNDEKEHEELSNQKMKDCLMSFSGQTNYEKKTMKGWGEKS